MALKKSEQETTRVLTALVATYRSTIDFFAKKDLVVKQFHPTPFPDWQRSDRHFNLISANARQVIRCEPNRIIVRAEGYPALSAFEEVVTIARRILEEFDVKDLFSATYQSVRARPMKSLEEARTRFVQKFLGDRAVHLLTYDELSDFAVTVERGWPATTDFRKVKATLAKLNVRERVALGPVSYDEIGEKFVEFRRNAENVLYRGAHMAPRFAILADAVFTIDRRKDVDALALDLLWRFYDWAKATNDGTWKQLEG